MSPSRKITYRDAVKEAIQDAMRRDARVFLMGEDVGRYGGAYGCSKGLLAEFGELSRLPRLEVHGLMTIAPYSPTPERVRPVFRRLSELRTECEQLLGAPLPQLSMGMSGDFEVAIEEGATLVRIGTALFGERLKRGEVEADP